LDQQKFWSLLVHTGIADEKHENLVDQLYVKGTNVIPLDKFSKLIEISSKNEYALSFGI